MAFTADRRDNIVDERRVIRIGEKEEYAKLRIKRDLGGNCGGCASSRVDAAESRALGRAIFTCSIKRNKTVNALACCPHFECK